MPDIPELEAMSGEWLLRQMQGLPRDQGREADHDEEWPPCDAGVVPRLRYEDLQDRRRIAQLSTLLTRARETGALLAR